MDFESIIPMFLISLMITVLAYLLVPIILVFSGKQYTEKEIKKIVVINSIVWFVIFFIIGTEQGSENVNFAPCVLWSSVAYAIMKKRCLTTNDSFDFKSNNNDEVVRIQLSSTDEQVKTCGDFNFYGKDLIFLNDEQRQSTKPLQSKIQLQKSELNPFYIAKELSEQSANSLITINRKCREIGIDYNNRKLAIATFSYFFVQWAYTSKNISFAQFGEVQKLYKEQFNKFNKIAFQDDSFKSVIENERMFTETLEKFLGYAKEFYNANNNSFSKKMIEKYILEFVKNESDIATLKQYL